MEQNKSIKLFQESVIRTHWDEESEKWYFSVVDTVRVLSESDNPRRYWSDLKRKLKSEGSELYENIVQEPDILSRILSLYKPLRP